MSIPAVILHCISCPWEAASVASSPSVSGDQQISSRCYGLFASKDSRVLYSCSPPSQPTVLLPYMTGHVEHSDQMVAAHVAYLHITLLPAGGLGSIGLSSLGTFSGLSRQPLGIRTAADRAAEAAARIPDPAPRSPKRKVKSVSFVEDGELTRIRYFLKVAATVNALICSVHCLSGGRGSGGLYFGGVANKSFS